MFQPRYQISPQLLDSIKRIAILSHELNKRRLPQLVLVELQTQAQVVSTYASTSIEGNPLPLTEVKRLLKQRPAQARQSELEVINYNQALVALSQDLGRPLTATYLLNIHRQVMAGLLPKHQTGQFRQEPVIIHDPRTRDVIFLPPDHADVPGLVADLLAFVAAQRGKLDPVILAGLLHKQLVVIHPFIDGNGRTTRLATKLLLAGLGLNTFNLCNYTDLTGFYQTTELPNASLKTCQVLRSCIVTNLFSFENYYNQNVSRYFAQVGATGNYYEVVDDLDFTPWLEYFAEGILDELLRVEKEIERRQATPDNILQPYHQAILDHIDAHGFITDKEYAGLTDRAKATRTLDFNKLIEMGLLIRQGQGRSTYYRRA